MKNVMGAAAALLLATAPVLAADSTAGSDSGMHPQSTQKPIPGTSTRFESSSGTQRHRVRRAVDGGLAVLAQPSSADPAPPATAR